jgi:hypothetical protein
LIIVGIGWYWWYVTPHVIYDKLVEKLSIPINESWKLADVRTLNITYKNDACSITELKFSEYISRDDVILMFSSNNMGIVGEEKLDFGYDKLTVRIEKNGRIDVIVLYNSNKVISFFCEKGNEEYILRWFVEKYG